MWEQMLNFKGEEITGWTQHPIPTKHLSGLLVARQQLPSLSSSSLFWVCFVFFPPSCCTHPEKAGVLLSREVFITSGMGITLPQRDGELLFAAVVWTGLALRLTRFGTRAFLSLSLRLALPSASFHRDEQQGANSHRKSGMELFKKQFSPNSGEDGEQAFHWSRHLLENTHCPPLHFTLWVIKCWSNTLEHSVCDFTAHHSFC